MTARSKPPGGALLLHDGELEDVRLLVVGAGADCTELRSGSAAPDRGARFRVVIGTGQRLASCRLPALLGADARIAILERDSKTLRAMLKRASVDYLVFRPVHPTALRLLVTRLLYQGPERRRGKRFSIGAPVSFRTGLFRRQALLADLSLQGCNLISPHSAKFGATLKLWFPAELTGDKPLTLGGQVSRVGPAGDSQPGSESLGVRFDAPGKRELAELRQLVERFREGPAAWTGQKLSRPPTAVPRSAPEAEPVPAAQGDRLETTASEVRARAPQRELPPAFRPAAQAGDGQLEAGDAASEVRLDCPLESNLAEQIDGGDRRQDQRRAFDRRVISRGDQKPCVLIGRDLSTGGLRVEATDRLELGLSVQLAIYVRAGEVPLVLTARVERDDGEDGFALEFAGLSGNQEAYLRSMLTSMPALPSIVGDDEPIVLCEITAA